MIWPSKGYFSLLQVCIIKSMEQALVPQSQCLGCKRFFLLNEKLPLESMTVQLKNYSLPLKQQFLKLTLLKTIVGFLNSKGGTIYMGVNDSNGQVLGVSLDRKQMDQFRLMIKQMLEKVQPTVDLTKSEEVSIDFVPVLKGKNKVFEGKYVIKFIILQGDPSKLYCISQKVKISSTNEVQVISAIRRHVLGGVEEIKGIKVIHQIYQKARNPHKVAVTFHEKCNPTPFSPVLTEKLKLIQEFKQQKIQQNLSKGEYNRKEKILSSSENSQKKLIIDKIKEKEKEKCQPAQDLPKNQNKNKNCIYLQNVDPKKFEKLTNFLKNSKVNKEIQKIAEQNGIIRIELKSISNKQAVMEFLLQKKVMNNIKIFGINSKINILDSFPSTNPESIKKNIQKVNGKHITNNKIESFIVFFQSYDPKYEKNFESYLENCLINDFCCNISKTTQGIEVIFYNNKEMYAFYELCNKPPQSIQLNEFWQTGKIKVKLLTRKDNSSEEKSLLKKKTYKSKQENAKQDQSKNSLTIVQEIKQKQKQTNKILPLELIASSLQPAEVTKLTNYIINCMSYKIHKKILASKDRFYIRIVFDKPENIKLFLQYCQIQHHKKSLSQFVYTKTFRIGVPGNSLLIYPYTKSLKKYIQEIILKVLGADVIDREIVKNYGGDKSGWSLILVDNSKILESYQKLEVYFRNQKLFINQKQVQFAVFLEYISIAQ